MEKSVDTLRAEMWRDRYTVIFNQYRALVNQNKILKEEYDVMAQDLNDFYEERCDLKEALLREKEDSEKYSREAIELRLRCEKLQEKIDEYEECEIHLREENARLYSYLKDMVDAGTLFLAYVFASVDGIDDLREAQFREAIEAGRKEVE